MFKKQFTTIGIATLATLGALAASAGSASALPTVGGSIKNPNVFRPGVSAPKPPTSKHVRIYVRHRHLHWGPRYRWVAYAPACYFVRRPAGLFKVCRVY